MKRLLLMSLVLVLPLLFGGSSIVGQDYSTAVLPSEQTVGNMGQLPSEATIPELRQAPDENGTAQKEAAAPVSSSPLLLFYLMGGVSLLYGVNIFNRQKLKKYENI